VGDERLSGRAALGVVQDSRSSISSKFTAAYRLLRADGFGNVMRAENIADKQFKIFFVRNCQKNARLGIITSKKILPCAVDRNRVKRIIRESFRKHNIKACKLDIVVMVRLDYSQKLDTRINNLERLFSQVENRCAES
jgi:ribonuclease P protein component